MTTSRDFVTHGVARLPEGSRKPNTIKYLSVYLRELVGTEDAVWQVLDGFRDWHIATPGATPSFVFDAIGRLIGQPRPSGFNDEDYRFILEARAIARISDATKPAVFRQARHLARGAAFGLLASVPEHWELTFEITLNSQWQTLYERLLFDTIAATDSLTLNLVSPGTLLYDDEFIGYDEGLYG